MSVFQSTPSARRATLLTSVLIAVVDISIHALREEGDKWMLRDLKHGWISIHALREEGDFKPVVFSGVTGISIHALREEGDAYLFCDRYYS